MRAIWITKAGGPDALELRETADPEPGPGQVRVRVRAAGLCFADVMAAQGLYPDAPKPPCVVGYEAAGVVDAGSSEDHPVGQRVLAVTHFGGHSDVVCVPAEQVSEIPDGASFEEAAAIPINYLTAYHLLFRIANVRPHERVLVHMAAGGVGTAALQLCRTVDELVTFGTASAAKHEVLRAEGCRYPIDYRTVDYAAEIRRLTGGEGVDVVLDALGGKDWRKGLKLLRPGGRLVAFGFANFARGERRNPARVAAQALATPLLTPPPRGVPGGSRALGGGPHQAAHRRGLPIHRGSGRAPPDPAAAERRQGRAHTLNRAPRPPWDGAGPAGGAAPAPVTLVMAPSR
jgi:NADPH:quinone reductase-like Zn-dependent oxidoreductase